MVRSVIAITDPDDERIAPFTAIREKDLVGRSARFIAEGTVVVRVLADAHASGGRFAADRLLVLQNRLAGLADVLAGLPECVPVYSCNSDVLNRIAGFDLHRGVLALGRVENTPPLETLLECFPDDALVVVCVGLSNHDNAGGIFRNATAFGADAVILDRTSCDPLYRKALRVSVGSVLKMPWHRGGEATQILGALSDAGFDVVTLSPSGKTALNTLKSEGRTALVVGTEGEGLPDDILARFQPVRIPQSGELDSLNVATAAGIALFQIATASGRVV